MIPGDTKLPDPAKLSRESDRALYALALYVYSLKAAAKPQSIRRSCREGKEDIRAGGAAPSVIPPPLYTNNMLTNQPKDLGLTEEEQKGLSRDVSGGRH